MRSRFLLLLAPLFLLGCASLQQNIDARKLLTECKYEYAGVKLDEISFSGIVPQSADLIVKVKITNPNSRPVALDHATLWVTLLIGDKTWETPLSIPFDFQVPVPWDQIDKAVAKKTKGLKDQAEKAAKQLFGKGKKS